MSRLARDHDVFTLQRRAPEPAVPAVRHLAFDLAALTPGRLAAAVGDSLDVVVHLAARLDNPFGIEYSLGDLVEPNVVGTARLLEAAAAIGVRRFVHGSTGGVSRNPTAGGLMFEDDPPGPVNAYGLTKHLAEQAVQAYSWPFERVSLRYFAPYGRGGSNPMFSHHLEAIERREEIVVGRGGGAELNPIHIDDAVAATVSAISAPDLPPVINVAGPDILTMAELIDLLARTLACSVLIRERDEPDASWAADTTRMRAFLGPAQVGIEEGIQREWGQERA